jgi:excisionase family DNA binding protein
MPDSPTPRWMKVDDARRYAGGVSRRTLYDAVRAGKLRAARIGAGRNFVFCAEWIDQYLEEAARESQTVRAVASSAA